MAIKQDVCLYEPATQKRIVFQYIPFEISDSREAKIQEIGITTRSNDIHQYTGGNDTLSFDITFNYRVEERAKMTNYINWLKSLTHIPNRGKEGRKVKLMFGELYRNELWVVQSVNTVFSNFDVSNGYMPQQAVVSIQLLRSPNKSITQADLRRRPLV